MLSHRFTTRQLLVAIALFAVLLAAARSIWNFRAESDHGQISYWLRRAQSRDAGVRREAMTMLPVTGISDRTRIAAALIAGAQDEDAAVRLAAVTQLSATPSNVADYKSLGILKALSGALRDRDDRVRAVAALGLSGTPETADQCVPVIIVLLDSATSEARMRAIEAAGSYGVRGGAALDVLLRRFKDPDPSIREKAVEAVGKVCQLPSESRAMHAAFVQARNEITSSPSGGSNTHPGDDFVGKSALANPGSARDSRIFELLRGLLLKDADPLVRYRAAETIARMGPRAASAVPDLIEFVAEYKPIGHMRPPDGFLRTFGTVAVPELLRGLRDKSPRVRDACVIALSDMIELVPESEATAFATAVKDASPIPRRFTLLGTGRLNVAVLLALLEDGDSGVRLNVLEELAKRQLSDQQAKTILNHLTDEADPQVKEIGLRLFGNQ